MMFKAWLEELFDAKNHMRACDIHGGEEVCDCGFWNEQIMVSAKHYGVDYTDD